MRIYPSNCRETTPFSVGFELGHQPRMSTVRNFVTSIGSSIYQIHLAGMRQSREASLEVCILFRWRG
jgi:hypothetical protein